MSHNVCLQYWVQPLRADGWQSVQGVGAHRAYTHRSDVEIRIKCDNYCFAVFLEFTKSPRNNSTMNFLSHFATGDWRGRLVLGCSMAQSLWTSIQLHEPYLSPSKVFHCGNMEFRTFYSRGLDLDPMTFIYEFDSVKVYPHTKINLLRQAFRKLSYTDRQT